MDGNKFAAYLKKRRKPEGTTNHYTGHAIGAVNLVSMEKPGEFNQAVLDFLVDSIPAGL